MKRNDNSGFTLLEVMTAVAVMGILVAMAVPSMTRMLERQQTKESATQMAGLLSDARARAVAEGTPHLVYFNAPSVDGNGNCSAAAVEVRDVDHSYSITPGDQTQEFHLSGGSCDKVKPFDPTAAASSSPEAAAAAAVPMPREDLAVKAPDAAEVGAVSALGNTVASVTNTATSTVATTVGSIAGTGSSGSSGSSGSGSGSSGSGSGSPASSSEDGGSQSSGSNVAVADLPPRTATVAESVVNGATFPVDGVSGRPVIAFSELGIPVDPANPSSWGSGAGGVYLTDSSGSTIVAALVAPLGEVKTRTYDPASQSWK
jgi:prepilin-type N-terminal cleavage/methylation domain-containing protein